MKKKKSNSIIKVRRFWKIRPVTKVKNSAKRYSRSKEKARLKRTLQSVTNL